MQLPGSPSQMLKISCVRVKWGAVQCVQRKETSMDGYCDGCPMLSMKYLPS